VQPPPTDPSQPAIDLKEPVLAAFLAWLVPGLGHLYQRRWAKAGLFFVCIMTTFVYGLYLGGSSELGWGRTVYFSLRQEDRRLPFFCQVGVGLPSLPALVQANRVRGGKAPLFKGFMAPPRINPGDGPADQPTLHQLHRQLHRYFELGTVYTMIAGLLNILAIYDAGAGPVFSEPKRKDDEDEQEGEQEQATGQLPAAAKGGPGRQENVATTGESS